MQKPIAALAAVTTALICASPQIIAAPTAAPQTIEELWKIVEAQQERIRQLEEESAAASKQLADTSARLRTNEQQVAESSQQLNELGDYTATLATSGSTDSSWAEKTQIGGYG